MTKNGYFVASAAALLFLLSFISAAGVRQGGGWFALWLMMVSLISLIGASAATYAAICDYLMENEE